MRIDSGYKLNGTGNKLFYEVFENGFDIFSGENATFPMLHQPEPYIPNPDISYEENAIQMCKDYGVERKLPFSMSETMYNNLTASDENMRADLDYLLLLNE